MFKLLFIVIIFMFSAFSEETSFREKLLSLEDHSNRVKLGLNSFPGKDEEIITNYVKSNNLNMPFIISVKYGQIVGETKAGKPISGATIYFVNPEALSGFLWWKKVKTYYISEPDWTFFKNNERPLQTKDQEAIKSLFNW